MLFGKNIDNFSSSSRLKIIHHLKKL